MIRTTMYRPFFRQHVVMDRTLNHRTYKLPRLFRDRESDNVGICIVASGSKSPFGVLATRSIPSLHLIGSDVTSFLPRWTHDEENDLFDEPKRRSCINPAALARFRTALGQHLDDDALFAYVYGVLHSPIFRDEFEVNLKKEAPRVPLPASREVFDGFAAAGRTLFGLHLTTSGPSRIRSRNRGRTARRRTRPSGSGSTSSSTRRCASTASSWPTGRGSSAMRG